MLYKSKTELGVAYVQGVTIDGASMFISAYSGGLHRCSYVAARPPFLTDMSTTEHCAPYYFDNNNGQGQTYTCPGGEFTGTALTCTGA